MSDDRRKKKFTYTHPAYYSLADVAVILRVSMQTVRRWIKEGKLPAIKIGGEDSRIIRVRREDLDDFIRNEPYPK